ncbi:MAG: adenylyl-sulfate kinase, partial [Thiotrichaceae bacterium]|nr:adenylyl-sulfate kinase [Thiotrichaceae bacterium]
EIKDFTGISSPYEAPDNPELRIDTHSLSLNESVETVIQFLKIRHVIPVKKLVNNEFY